MKTQPTHTPGPWHINKIGRGYGVFTQDTHQVAGIIGLTSERDEANARLIAAAPELLEAAKKLSALLHELHKEEDPEYLPAPELDDLDLAIQKAEGRSND